MFILRILIMEDVSRRYLEKHWNNIVNEVEVDSIVDKLYSLQILTLNDLEKIHIEKIPQKKTSCFLNILTEKNDTAYEQFVDILKTDYYWIAKGLQNGNEEVMDKIEHEVFQDTLVLGDVPRRPRHYVLRTAPLQRLQDQLAVLQPTQRIVLHGMTGCGKSCLAASAVKDSSLLQTSFKNRVFWINLGDVKEIDQLLFHMHLLLQRMMNDSREANTKTRPLSMQEGNSTFAIETMKDLLKNMFRRGSFRDALLVLDNVSLKEATQAFDVGCKTLITTQQKDIVIGNNTEYIQIKDGFTEEETLLLFANCLKTDSKNLPVYATKIHDLCKGVPILVSLIGSLLEPYQQQLLRSSELWKYYISKLTKKENDFQDQLFGAISLSMAKLTPKLRDLYQYFAVFVDDINITSKVMQTIWRMEDKFEVQHIMTELENKSLIVSFYNLELKTYVYGIHDLFLAYLRQNTTEPQMIEQHRKLISAYKQISDDSLCNLPNDNYIYQYVGYHLKAARLYDDFKVYFDLKFLGAKIKEIGTADLLKDFHLYKDCITQDDKSLDDKLEEYTNFVKAKGHDLHKYKDTDIIQCGLGQNKEGFVYKAALEIAKDTPKHLYFNLQAPQERQYFTHTLDLHYDVSAACFTSNVNRVLVGMESGDIVLWQQPFNQKLHIFYGHTERITQLQLSSNQKSFLSVSKDGCAKIWNLRNVINQSSTGDLLDMNGYGKAIPSPRVKQPNWTNFYGNTGRMDHSKTCALDTLSDKIISASYAHESDYLIVTGCTSGRVIIWNIEDDPYMVVKIPGRGQPANCVTFSADDSLVIFSCGTNIYMYDSKDGEFLCEFCNKVIITSLLLVPELATYLISINTNSITIWTWNQVGLRISNPVVTELDNRKHAKFLCGAVTEDGLYLVTGSTDYYIRVWQIETSQIVQEILNDKELVVCLDTFYDDTRNAVHILLSGSDDKTVKQWRIQPTAQKSDTSKLLPIFDCFWNYSSSIPRIAAVNASNVIQIMNGYNLLIESNRMPSPIKVIRFSLCGNKIAMGLENGDVIEFDFKNRQYETLMKLHDSVVLLKYFNISREEPNGCAMVESQSYFMLVATAQNGWVTVYKNNRALCLIQPPPSNISLKQMSVIPIVQCFYIKAADKLLAVSQNRTIKAWNLETGTCDILFGDRIHNTTNNTVTMATISVDQSQMAITMTDHTFEVYTLDVIDSKIITTLSQGKLLNSPLTCCRFSHNAKILALGQDNGDVVIWSIELKSIIGTLHLHKSQVSYLLFSPAPALILISVGDQIGWWDLTKLPEDRSPPRRRRSSTAKKRSLTIDTAQPMSLFNFGLWNHKEGSLESPHLLSSIKVRGLWSTYISASLDFSSFFTIDKNGYLYIMEMLS